MPIEPNAANLEQASLWLHRLNQNIATVHRVHHVSPFVMRRRAAQGSDRCRAKPFPRSP